MIIIGQKEVESNVLSVRSREGDVSKYEIEEFIKCLKN